MIYKIYLFIYGGCSSPICLSHPTYSSTIPSNEGDIGYPSALPPFQAVGQNITLMGPSGSGQVTKLANQLIVAQAPASPHSKGNLRLRKKRRRP